MMNNLGVKVHRYEKQVSNKIMYVEKVFRAHFYLGSAGSGASNPRLRQIFGIGRGTSNDYIRRCSIAICSLKDKVAKRPEKEDRI